MPLNLQRCEHLIQEQRRLVEAYSPGGQLGWVDGAAFALARAQQDLARLEGRRAELVAADPRPMLEERFGELAEASGVCGSLDDTLDFVDQVAVAVGICATLATSYAAGGHLAHRPNASERQAHYSGHLEAWRALLVEAQGLLEAA